MKTIELFCGAGGLALGLEKAGFELTLALDFNKQACQTLQQNKPQWNVVNTDITNYNFSPFKNISLVTGGFPCQPFSYAGKGLGIEDTRGTLFYHFARCIKEVSPDCFLAENVRGLLTHNKGKTFQTVLDVFKELGYHIKYEILNAYDFQVPQKRERIFIIGFKDIKKLEAFSFPSKNPVQYVVGDIINKSLLYPHDIKLASDHSSYTPYSKNKLSWVKKIPQGGNWKSLSIEEQKSYMGNMFLSGGGKTGVLKRLSLKDPSPTLLCSPSQKQTERIHPLKDQTLSIREYARIQTFPDNWNFVGSISQKYKQIGNAVPVNLAYAIGQQIKKTLSEK